MKISFKKVLFAVIAGLIGITLLTGIAFSSDLSELIRVYRNDIVLEVNGARVAADNFIYNGRTYVPLRAVAEMLGKDVGWNAITNVASIKDMAYQKDTLSKLLPNNAGYKWVYNGFAEYDHNMTLNSITDQTAKRIYNITGIVGDPSGGEGTADRNIDLQYIIENNNLIQQKNEQVMMDSIFNRITLIQTPLVLGTYWEERLIDKTGKTRDIYSQIIKIETLATGEKQYTVKYSDSNSAYYEQRVIREGIGIVNFEKLYEYDGGSSSIGYFLINQDNVVYKDVTVYFSDSNADKLWAEVRSVPVIDSRVAYAALQALIDGPQISGHYKTIPEGTIILDIGISNGICTVNFSREFIDNHWGGSAGELLTLGSIVNTLTEFPTIQKVMILVDGKAGETLGNILLDQPLVRMNDMIGK